MTTVAIVQARMDSSRLPGKVLAALGGADLALVRAVHDGLGGGDRIAPYAEVVAWLRARPALCALNAGVVQRSWHTDEVRP